MRLQRHVFDLPLLETVATNCFACVSAALQFGRRLGRTLSVEGLGRREQHRAGRVDYSVGATAVLAALGAGNVLITSDNKVLLSVEGGKAIDPTTGETVVAPADAQALTLNNRLRSALQSALVSAELFSPQRAVRLAAAQRLQKEADPARAPLLERALEKEQDLDIKSALSIALASASIKRRQQKCAF
jgi:hypothetical protein